MSNNTVNGDDLNVTGDSVLQEKKDFLLNKDNFERLMKAQREIEEVTEMRPTFKKLINALVTDEAVNKVKDRIIEKMS